MNYFIDILGVLKRRSEDVMKQLWKETDICIKIEEGISSSMALWNQRV